MKYALSDGKPTEAAEDAPKYARCIYCGLFVTLSKAPYMNEYSYFHTDDLTAYECQKLRQLEPANKAGEK